MPKKQSKLPTNRYVDVASADDLGPSERIAYDIVVERRDLLPSVDRIMSAELPDDARLRAMTLFQDSLASLDDPHRDPRVSIAASMDGTAKGGTAG